MGKKRNCQHGAIRWVHERTRNFMDPFRVALTLSKSELMHRRKWSEGFLRAGQGNPAWAKNCICSHQEVKPQDNLSSLSEGCLKRCEILPRMPPRPDQNKQFSPQKVGRADRKVRRLHYSAGGWRQLPSFHPSTVLEVSVLWRKLRRCHKRKNISHLRNPQITQQFEERTFWEFTCRVR